jgi:hypothetical protein
MRPGLQPDELKGGAEPRASELLSDVGNVLGAQAERLVHIRLKEGLGQRGLANEP